MELLAPNEDFLYFIQKREKRNTVCGTPPFLELLHNRLQLRYQPTQN